MKRQEQCITQTVQHDESRSWGFGSFFHAASLIFSCIGKSTPCKISNTSHSLWPSSSPNLALHPPVRPRSPSCPSLTHTASLHPLAFHLHINPSTFAVRTNSSVVLVRWTAATADTAMIDKWISLPLSSPLLTSPSLPPAALPISHQEHAHRSMTPPLPQLEYETQHSPPAYVLDQH